LGCKVKLRLFVFPLEEDHYLLEATVEVTMLLWKHNLRFIAIQDLLLLCF